MADAAAAPAAPPQRRGRAARLAQPAHAGQLRGRRVRHAAPRPVRRPGRPGSPTTSPGRCPACRPATTSSAARSTSCGGRGARSSCGSEPITADLRAAGVTTMLVSDHPHLFETGGENYHTEFAGWDYVRGHEGDPWRTTRDTSWVGTPAPPARDGGWFCASRGATAWRSTGPTTAPAPSSGPRRTTPAPGPWPPPPSGSAGPRPSTTAGCCSSTSSTPTSPSTRRAPVARPLRGRAWDDDLVIWPPYEVGGVSRAWMSERQARHIRANYGAKLSMIDRWFGEMVAALDERRAVGRHRGRRLHRPRPLPRRRRGGRRHLGQARGAAVRAARAHPAARPLARRPRRAGRATRSPPASTSSPRWPTCSAWRPATAPTAARCVPLLAGTTPSVRDWALGGV